jgi:hypothetical protein
VDARRLVRVTPARDMARPTYAVRRCDATEVRETLTGLWRRNLHMRGDLLDKYRWFYTGSPHGAAQAFVLEATTESGRDQVGCCGLGQRNIYVDGALRRAGLLADFAVDDGHRSALPALTLQRALAEYARREFDLTYAYPNDSAIGVLRRVRYTVAGTVARYVRILQSADYVQRHVRPRPIASLVAAAADGVRSLGERQQAWRHGRLRFEWLEDADSRFDALQERARAPYRLIADRSQQFLRWRFTRRPGVAAQYAVITDPRTDDLAAYAVIIEKDPGAAIVADFLAATLGDLRALVRRLWPELRRKRFKTATAFFLGSPAVAAALVEAGFTPRPGAKSVVVTAGESGLVDQAALSATDAWYLTEADRDN